MNSPQARDETTQLQAVTGSVNQYASNAMSRSKHLARCGMAGNDDESIAHFLILHDIKRARQHRKAAQRLASKLFEQTV